MRCPRRNEIGAYPAKGEDSCPPNGTCSYCGSLSQEAFFDYIEKGGELGPTDKNYKVYTRDFGKIKFYFQHLDESGQQRFVDLLNSGTLKIGYPGYFYTRPFFVAYKDQETPA